MDHVFTMGLAVLGIIGFLLWDFRPNAPLALRLLISVPAIGWLLVYVLVELARSEPALWTGRAEMNVWTVMIIAMGIYVLMSKPAKPAPVKDSEPPK